NANRAAEQGHGIRRKRCKYGGEIEPLALFAGMDSEVTAEQRLQLFQIGRIAPRADRVMQGDIGIAASQCLRDAENWRDADAAGDQAIMRPHPVDLELRGW